MPVAHHARQGALPPVRHGSTRRRGSRAGTIEEENRDPAKGTEVLMALRLRVQERQITEIEE